MDRALGNTAFINYHIPYLLRLNAVKSLVMAMEHHKEAKSILQLGIDVIGNFSSVDEEQYEKQFCEGRLVSVASSIWHEGGAKKFVDTSGGTSDPELVASCIRSLVHRLQDVDVRRKLIGRNIDSIELLSYNFEGIESIYSNSGVSILLQQLDLNIERTNYVQTLTQALVNMSNLKDSLN